MFLRLAAAALLSMVAVTSLCHAQGAVPAQPSSAFNWLNLNRQGGSTAQNYFGIVRPNNMFQNSLQNVQQEFGNLTQSATNADPNMVRATGHAATFMNYGHYYPRLGTGTGIGTARSGQGMPSSKR
ncbi:MAG TPA: hypothetical protein PLN21_00995 [Gemmatales bacterium]|nr:hypothetical protein [Gemmatales bacterium]